MTVESTSLADDRRKTFVLQEIQPGLLGMMDGSVSTLAPIFATAGVTGRPLSAFFVGLRRPSARPSAWVFRRRCPTTEALPDAAARCDVVQ